jgi:hypothetical protein
MSEIKIELNKIIIELRDSSKLVKDGVFIDLKKISEKIEQICHKINKNPPKDTDETEKKVATVISELNQLSKRLKQQQNASPKNRTDSIGEKNIKG